MVYISILGGGRFFSLECVYAGLNSLPNDKFLDWSKLKAVAHDKCGLKIETCFENGRKHCWKRKKCWLPAFSPFPAMFLKSLLCWGSLKDGFVW